MVPGVMITKLGSFVNYKKIERREEGGGRIEDRGSRREEGGESLPCPFWPLALLTNITLGWIGLKVPNTLAYLAQS